MRGRLAPTGRSVFTGVNPVFTPLINTVKEGEMVNIIQYSGDEPDGVKVLSEIPGERENNLKVEDGGLKVPTPEPAEDDFQKIHGGNWSGEKWLSPTRWILCTRYQFMSQKWG